MAKVCFVEKKFSRDREFLIDIVNSVVDEFVADGYRLTLRQLYYQLIARDLLPDSWADEHLRTKNTQRNYKRLGSLVNDARLAGRVDWDAIEDRGRNLQRNSSWYGPMDILRSVASQYHIDMWENQDYRPEVWIEKESLIGVIAPTCTALDVPYYATRGYNSASEMYEAHERIFQHMRDGYTPVIIHLGDHDPSGIDMTRDNRDRLELMLGETVTVKRIALNYSQVQQYNPPPNPAKSTDARYAGYEERYGDESWELDALNPAVINQLIRSEIESMIDEDAWAEQQDRLDRDKKELDTLYYRWRDVEAFIRGINGQD